MNEKKVQSRKRNQNQTQKKSRDRQAQPRNTFGNQHRSQFQAAFQIFCRRWLPVCIAALILSGTANLLRESRLQQEVAAKIVRFHVRANSDCASDQQIKLQVRDAVAEEQGIQPLHINLILCCLSSRAQNYYILQNLKNFSEKNITLSKII